MYFVGLVASAVYLMKGLSFVGGEVWELGSLRGDVSGVAMMYSSGGGLLVLGA